MTREDAKKKICPLMSTGFSADTERLRNEGTIYVQCEPDVCMLWSPIDENNGDCTLSLLAIISEK